MWLDGNKLQTSILIGKIYYSTIINAEWQKSTHKL